MQVHNYVDISMDVHLSPTRRVCVPVLGMLIRQWVDKDSAISLRNEPLRRVSAASEEEKATEWAVLLRWIAENLSLFVLLSQLTKHDLGVHMWTCTRHVLLVVLWTLTCQVDLHLQISSVNRSATEVAAFQLDCNASLTFFWRTCKGWMIGTQVCK